MRLEYDSKKSEKNRIERSLSFDRAGNFDWENAIYDQDTRRAYPEKVLLPRVISTSGCTYYVLLL